MNHPAPTSPSLDAALAQVADFPERLGPVLIKELRQGLRSGLFALPFVILPAVLALVAMWALSIENLREARQGVAGFFWGAVFVPVLILTPLRALGAIRAEREAQTLDLLQLTPLSAWRIVLAKWSSLMAQALLWVAALLPFFVLRYFFGGMDLAGEAFFLTWVLVSGGVLTAIGLVISTLPRVVFWLSLGGMLIFGLWLMVVMVFERMSFLRAVGYRSGIEIAQIVLLALLAAHVTYLALAFASSRIAPLADNYALRLRAGTLAVFAWFALAWIPQLAPTRDAPWPFFVAALITSTLLTAIELTNARTPLRKHVLLGSRFGTAGRLLGRTFLPGWPSAVIFYSGVIVLAAVVGILNSDEDAEVATGAALLWTAVMFPRALQCVFARASGERPGLHLIIHLLGPVIAATLAAFSFVLGAGMIVPAAVFPPSLLWLVGFESVKLTLHREIIGLIAGLWVLGIAAVFVRHGRGYWAQVRTQTGNSGAAAASPSRDVISSSH